MYRWNQQAPRVARARARVSRGCMLSPFSRQIYYVVAKRMVHLTHSSADAEVLADLLRFDKGVEHGDRGGGVLSQSRACIVVCSVSRDGRILLQKSGRDA